MNINDDDDVDDEDEVQLDHAINLGYCLFKEVVINTTQ